MATYSSSVDRVTFFCVLLDRFITHAPANITSTPDTDRRSQLTCWQCPNRQQSPCGWFPPTLPFRNVFPKPVVDRMYIKICKATLPVDPFRRVRIPRYCTHSVENTRARLIRQPHQMSYQRSKLPLFAWFFDVKFLKLQAPRPLVSRCFA